MKKLTLLMVFLVSICGAHASSFTFTNNFTFTEPDCSNPPLIKSDEQGKKEFGVTMSWSGDPGSFSGYYDRTYRSITFLIRNSNGDVVKEVSISTFGRVGSMNFDLTTTDLQGLPSGNYTVDLKIVYTLSGNSPNPVFMNVQRNGSQVASADLDSTDPFEVILSNVDCFEYFYCGAASMYPKLGSMRAVVSGGSGNYTYSWSVDPKTGNPINYGNQSSVPLQTGCWTYFLTVIDNVTGCVLTSARRYCNYEVEICCKEEVGIGLDSLVIKDPTTEMRFFPNPVNDQLFIELPQENGQYPLFRLLDGRGRVIKEIRNIDKGQLNLPMTDIPGGVYYINTIDASGKNTTQKILKID